MRAPAGVLLLPVVDWDVSRSLDVSVTVQPIMRDGRRHLFAFTSTEVANEALGAPTTR